MNLVLNSLSVITLCCSSAMALAAPEFLTTHNRTDSQSNAYIAGIPSPHYTNPRSDRQVYWNLVRYACYGHTTANGTCSAVVKMDTDKPNPIEIGTLTLNLNTGDITPKELSANGYTITVNGLGETTITKD